MGKTMGEIEIEVEVEFVFVFETEVEIGAEEAARAFELD